MTHETQGPEKGEKHTKDRPQLGGEALFTKILDSEKDGQGMTCSVSRDDGLGGLSPTAQQNCLAGGCKRDFWSLQEKTGLEENKGPRMDKGLQDFSPPEEEIMGN